MIIRYLRNLARHLMSDPDIAKFCHDHYSRPLTVFIGDDPRNLPDMTNCPMIVFSIGGRQLEPEDASTSIMRRLIKIGIAVFNEQTELEEVDDSIFEIDNYEVFEYFIALIQRIVERFQDPEGEIATVPSSGPDDVTEPPVYKAWLGLLATYETNYFEGV